MVDLNFQPIKLGAIPKEGPKALATTLPVDANGIIVDLLAQNIRGQISQIEMLYIDNGDNNIPLFIYMEGTKQRITCPPNSQGYFQLLMPNSPKLLFTAASAISVPIQFLNFRTEPIVWSVLNVTTLNPNDIVLPDGEIIVGNSLGQGQARILHGDGSIDDTAALTVLKTNGVPFASSATIDTTNAANISSGTLPNARLPAPTVALLGGVKSLAAVAHKFLTSIDLTGTPTAAQPATTDLSDFIAGTYTPADVSGAGLVFSAANGFYFRIGNLVIAGGRVVYPANASGAVTQISLPVVIANQLYNNVPGPIATDANLGFALVSLLNTGAASFSLYNARTFNTSVTNTNVSGHDIRFLVAYSAV